MAEDNIKEVDTTEVKQTQPSVGQWTRGHKSVLTIVGLTVVFLLLLCGAFAAGKHAGGRLERPGRFGVGQTTRGVYGQRGSMTNGGGFGRGAGFNNAGTDSANSTRVSGVVTAVDGSTVTVAGNGTTTKVTVSSSTTYVGSSQPAQVNDTIMASGARDGSGNLVAATVRLSRQ